MHSWNTFGAWTSHMQTQTHKIHHGPNLGEAITFPLIIFFVPDHGANTQMSFCPKILKLGVSKFPKLGPLQLWKPIIFCEDFRLRWSLKQSCNPRQEISNGMWHTTCTQVNQGDSLLLVVGNQIGNLILNPSFGHNLCLNTQMGHASPFRHLSFKSFSMI